MIATCALALLAEITVTLPPQAEVRGTELVLGRIATVTGTDPALVEKARTLSLGYAPAPGYSRLLQSWQIERALQGAFPALDLEVVGSSSLRIQPVVEQIAATEIAATARTQLDELFAGRDATIAPAPGLLDAQIPAGDRPYSLRPRLEPRGVRPGRWNVPVDVLVDGAVYRTVWTAWEVELWSVVPVLTRDVLAGETLRADTMEMRRERMTPASSRSLGAAAFEGSVARRSLTRGTLIQARDVTRPALVERGDLVQLQIRNGAITARVAAHASQSGYRGDRILVTTVDGGRELTAIVVGRDFVQVDLTTHP